MNAIHSVFTRLSGSWSFSRIIEGSMQATATGEARFTPQDDATLLYHEEGTMHLPHGATMNFFRSYHYVLSDNYLDVLYGDGPQTGEHYQSYTADDTGTKLLPLSTHVCSADCYRGVYDLLDENGFTLTTTVKGPHKDYTIKTDYRRQKTAEYF